jgi:site-specific DNA recombinase
LSQLSERHEAAAQAAERERDLRLVISRLEDFAAKVSEGLDNLNRVGQRDIIRALVKRIEVDSAAIEIIFRVPTPNAPVGPATPANTGPAWRQCTAGRRTHLRTDGSLETSRARLWKANRRLRGHDPGRNAMDGNLLRGNAKP